MHSHTVRTTTSSGVATSIPTVDQRWAHSITDTNTTTMSSRSARPTKQGVTTLPSTPVSARCVTAAAKAGHGSSNETSPTTTLTATPRAAPRWDAKLSARARAPKGSGLDIPMAKKTTATASRSPALIGVIAER